MRLSIRDLGAIPYRKALELQESLVARKLAGDATDYLLLVEHEPVYTLGRAADIADLREADDKLGVDTVRIGRGGGVTFHGPGQLVAYPILSLATQGHDVGRYVRSLEQVLLSTCEYFGVGAARRPGAPGAWVGDKKIASVGIQVRRWVAFHGVALNVSTDLTFFSAIAPCRMPGVRMTNLADEASRSVCMDEVREAFVESFRRQFDPSYLEPQLEVRS
jgi:lipoate-protein ligase B